MLYELLNYVTGCFRVIALEGSNNPSSNVFKEIDWVNVIKNIDQLYDGLRVLGFYRNATIAFQGPIQGSCLTQQTVFKLAEYADRLSFFQDGNGRALVFMTLARRLSEIDQLGAGMLCQILDSIRWCAVRGVFGNSGSTQAIRNQGFDAIMDAVLAHVDKANVLDTLEVSILFEILPKLSNKDTVDAVLKILPPHISKLANLDKIIDLDKSVLQRKRNSALQKIVFTLDSWACSPLAGDVLKAMAQSISRQDRLELDDISLILYLLEEVISIQESVDLMAALTPHIESNVKGFDLIDIFRTISCVQYVKISREQILSALIRRLDSIRGNENAEDLPISMSSLKSSNYVRCFHKNANNFSDAGLSYDPFFFRSRVDDSTDTDDYYDPDDPENSYEIDTDAPSFSWLVCLAANSIQSLSELLREQNESNGAKKFVSTLLKKMNYSFDTEKLHSIHEQQMLVKDLLKDRRTKTEIDLRGLPINLAEFYLDSVLNELSYNKSVLPELKLVFGNLANTIHNKSTFLPLKIVFGPDNAPAKRRPQTLHSMVKKSISQELARGVLRAKWDGGSVILKRVRHTSNLAGVNAADAGTPISRRVG